MKKKEAEKPTPLSTKVEQLLTEARVIIPGAQALLGFQFTVTLTRSFEQLPAGASLTVDGAPRGAGPIEPGARRVTVSDGVRTVVDDTLHVDEGERVDAPARDRRRGSGLHGRPRSDDEVVGELVDRERVAADDLLSRERGRRRSPAAGRS